MEMNEVGAPAVRSVLKGKTRCSHLARSASTALNVMKRDVVTGGSGRSGPGDTERDRAACKTPSIHEERPRSVQQCVE